MSKPTPWQLCIQAESFANERDEDEVFEMRSIVDKFGRTVISDEYGIDRLTLEKIVRCVNMHEELVHALKILRNETKGTLGAHQYAIGYDHGNSNWACLEIALKQAEDALAKAEGRTE